MKKIKKWITLFVMWAVTVIGMTEMGSLIVSASEVCLVDEMDAEKSESGWTYIENGDGTVTLTGYTEESLEGKVVLPETLGGMPVTVIAENALRESHMSSVIIPANVERIGEAAFRSCGNLFYIVFLGDAPEPFYNDEDDFEDDMMEDEAEAIFGCVTAKAFYPPDNETWTEDVRTSYGKYLTWYIYKEASDDSNRTWMYSKNEDGTIELAACLGDELKGKVEFPSELEGMVVTVLGNGIAMGCSEIESAVIPEEVTTIGDRAFAGCSSLTEIQLPNKVTSIGLGAFRECTNLESIVLPDGMTDIRAWTFEDCSRLESIILPESITNIEWYAFIGCSSLKEINIPANIIGIEPGVFAECENLANMIIPENVTYIGDGAFEGCSSLKDIVLPEKLERIQWGAFKECMNLRNMIIPANVEIIGDEAFYGCSGLETVRFEGSAPQVGGGGYEYFGGVFTGTSATIYYPSGNETWTEEVIDLYSYSILENSYIYNENLRWVSYEKQTAKPVTQVFTDVYGDWYVSYVQYVYDNSLMTGIRGTTLFQPDANITKAQMAQVLYNMEGQPTVTEKKVFTELKDVYKAEWYENAVAWAYNTGVVTGDLNTKEFSPNTNVTREQLALMLYRYSALKGYGRDKTSDLAGLKNAENVSNWAADGVKWAVGSGLISGVEKDGVKDLAPQGNATRAQVAAILMRFSDVYGL